VSWLIFLQREDLSTTFTDSSSCSILSKASLLSSRRVLVKLQLLKKTLKLLPVATRQTFPCKCTVLTDSNASLCLFSSFNYETNGIKAFTDKTYPKKCFRKLESTCIIIKRKWHKFFNREVSLLLIGRFQEHTLH